MTRKTTIPLFALVLFVFFFGAGCERLDSPQTPLSTSRPPDNSIIQDDEGGDERTDASKERDVSPREKVTKVRDAFKQYSNENFGIAFDFPERWFLWEYIYPYEKTVNVADVDPSSRVLGNSITVTLPIREIGYEIWDPVLEEKIILDGVAANKTTLIGRSEHGATDDRILIWWNFDDYWNSGQLSLICQKKDCERMKDTFDAVVASFQFLP